MGHYDYGRSGANTNETILTPENVRPGQFGRIGTLSVEGCVAAQPLYVPGVEMSDGRHNVVYVATTANILYGFDADTLTLLFVRRFGAPMPSSDVPEYYAFPSCDGTDDVGPIGIVGTPVIDLEERALYLVSTDIEGSDSARAYRHFLHKINTATGEDLLSRREIKGAKGAVPFQSRYQLQRSALLLLNGRIYVAFGSHRDEMPYHGWLFSYDKRLKLKAVANYSPGKSGSGIWQSGGGPATDGQFIYLATGNSAEGVPDDNDTTNSVLKIDPQTLEVQRKTSFLPESYDWDWNVDLDLGSSRVIVLPEYGMVASGSKFGDLFLIDDQTMELKNRSQVAARHSFGFDWTGIYNGFAYWNMTLFLWPGGGGSSEDPSVPYAVDFLKAYSVSNGEATIAARSRPDGAGVGYQGADLTISSNGNNPATGILWAATPEGNSQWLRSGNLRAYAIGDFAGGFIEEIWNDVAQSVDAPYAAAKFTQPLVANGRVYLPTFSASVIVFGLTENR